MREQGGMTGSEGAREEMMGSKAERMGRSEGVRE